MSVYAKVPLRNLALRLCSIPIVGPNLLNRFLVRKYGKRVVTPAKVRNFLLARQEYQKQALEVKSKPYILNLDTLDVCNLSCPYCPTGTKNLNRKNKRLPLADAKAVIDAVKDFVLEVRLFNWGEPMLNPEIFDLIAYARDAGLYTVISSNLSIEIEDFGERIVEAGLDFLWVSIDGLEQKTLEQYRRGAEFDLIYRNIRSVVEARKKAGTDYPWVELVFLVFRHNEHELPLLPGLREEWGADAFRPSPAFIFKKSDVPLDPKFKPIPYLFDRTCRYLYYEIMVEADGNISPCCSNTDSRFDVGTIDDLKDISAFWNKPVFRAMRAVGTGKSTGDGPLETLCDHCRLIGPREPELDGLSPIPPSQIANGDTAASIQNANDIRVRAHHG